MVETLSKLEQNHRDMFFSLALLSFEDTYIDILSTEEEGDNMIRRDVSISGLDVFKNSKKNVKDGGIEEKGDEMLSTF